MIISDELYSKIIKSMPILCVDLLITDKLGRVLMVRRNNPPAKGQWWFPGGRVFYREHREAAALRKIKEECGLNPAVIEELGTYELMFGDASEGYGIHAVTTVFLLRVEENEVRLDSQSSEFLWNLPGEWLKVVEHEFLLNVLQQYRSKAKK